MAQFKQWFTQDLTESIVVRHCESVMFTGDDKGAVVGVRLYDNGAAYSGGGTVTGAVKRIDGGLVPLTGTLSGNAASVVIPAAALAYPGPIGVHIVLTQGSSVTTVLKAIYSVDDNTGTPVDPGDIVPNYEELLSEIAAMRQATADANAAAEAALSTQDTLEGIITDITGIGIIQFSDPSLKQYIVTNGTTVQWDTPSVSAYSNIKWAVVPCSAGDVFTINGRGGNADRLWAFADSSKNIISVSAVSASGTDLVLTAPANAAYLIINDETDRQSYIGDTTANKDVITTLNNTNRTITGNLYETTVVGWENGYVDANGAEQPENTLLQRSGYIPIIGAKYIFTHFVHGGVDQEIKGAFYDAQKVFIPGGAIQRGDENHKIPDTAAYVRLNRIKFADVRKTDEMSAFFNDGPKSKWSGKTINALGDSITYGYGLSDREADRWTTLVENKTGATVNNFGVPSSRVSEITGDAVQSFVDRVSTMPSADLNIIFGGTNDYWLQLTNIGEYNSNNNADFCGALNYIFNYLQTNNPTGKILFIFPMHQYFVLSGTAHSDGDDLGRGTLNDFRKGAIETCAYRGVPILDLYANSGTCVSLNLPQRNAYTIDGVHPNVAGHKLIADLVADCIEYRI